MKKAWAILLILTLACPLTPAGAAIQTSAKPCDHQNTIPVANTLAKMPTATPMTTCGKIFRQRMAQANAATEG